MLPEAADFKRNWQDAQKARLAEGVEADSYVYVHLQEDTGEPFYVGIGHTHTRPWDTDARSDEHKERVSEFGICTHLVEDCVTYEVAKWWEVRWIKALRDAGYELVNKTDGGEGVRGLKWTDEQKSAQSKLFTEYYKTPEGLQSIKQMAETKRLMFSSDAGNLTLENLSRSRYKFLSSNLGQEWSENHQIWWEEFLISDEGKKWCSDQSERLTEFYKTDEGKASIIRAAESRRAFYDSPAGEIWKIEQGKTISSAMKNPSVRWNLMLRDWHRSNVRPHKYWGA
jgi:hypothetical protein